MPELATEEITSGDALAALAPEWAELWQRAPGATPFQSPAWLMPWWRHFGQGELLTVTARTDGRLAGLLPLYVLREGPVRKLLPLGIGVSDYCDALIAGPDAAAVADALAGHLARTTGRWDVCDLQPLPASSPLLRTRLPAGFAAALAPQEPCPVLTLPGHPDELDRVLPKRMRQNLRYYRRRAAAAGRVTVAAARADTLAQLFGTLLDLHGARWAGRGAPGVLAETPVRAFHEEAARRLMADGVVRLFALALDGRVIGCWYGFLAKGRAYYYLGGFDPAAAALSPGTLLIGHAATAAAGEGARELDFLRGAEPYKYLWGAVDRPTFARRLRHDGTARRATAGAATDLA